MKRISRARVVHAVVLVALVATLALPAAALAGGGPDTHGAPLPGNPAGSRPLPAAITGVPTVQEMVARVCSVSGTITSFAGAPVAGAEVYGGYVNGNSWLYSPQATTDPSGAYSIANLPASPNGFVETWYKESGEWRGMWVSPLDFVDGSANTVNIQPGRIGWQAVRSGYWKTWKYPSVQIGNTDQSGARTDYTFDNSGTEYGDAEAVPGTVNWASMNFWWDEAAEWFAPAPVTITAGANAGNVMYFDEATALRCYINNLYWGSCRPGTTVKLAMWNWPAGHQAKYFGWEDSPSQRETAFGGKSWTSPGKTPRLVSLRIPASAKAGYGYILAPYRNDNADSALMLKEYVQLATLNKASASGGIRLSGIVPTKGHWGSQAGIRKAVNIYSRSSKRGVPTKWDPSGQGWHKVASLRCTGTGAYKSGILRPAKDTWYVARYAGDSWYWGAFTNVVMVNR